MPSQEIEFKPVNHITTDAIGPPGKRIFYIQAWQEERTVTLILEKIQVQSLAVSFEQFLVEIAEKYPDLPEATIEYDESMMRINPPVDPLFRVGDLGLGYDSDDDLIVLALREIVAEGESEEEADLVRLWCTRSQMRSMCRWGIEVSNRGRPLCPQCGEPMDPEGHFCPKKNGHKH